MAKLLLFPVFTEVNLEVLKGSIGLDIVETIIMIWNHVEMLINGEDITTSGFCESHFGSVKKSYWSWHGRKDDWDLKSGGNVN